MRNLKKILALVLSLMMVLSVMVTASAADFSDADEIQYTEAVEVMSALGILNGVDGKFVPNGTLERAQAAKIIAYIKLGADTEDLLATLTTNKFADVTGGWAMPYITYCSNEGIIDGYKDADGVWNFGPKGTLQGYAFAKMVLNALGIDGDYTGSNWTLEVAKNLNSTKGLKDGLANIKLSENITREQAAQLAFNAMKYTGSATTGKYIVVPADSNTTLGAAIGDEVFDSRLEAITFVNAVGTYTLSTTDSATSYTVEEQPDSTQSLMATSYGAHELTKLGTDDFRHPYAKIWVNADDEVIYSELKPIAATYTGKTTAAVVAADLGLDYTVAAEKSIADTVASKTANGKVLDVYTTLDSKGSVVGVTYAYVLYTAGKVTVTEDAKTGDVTYEIGGKSFVDYKDNTSVKDTVVLMGEVADGSYVTYAVSANNSQLAYIYPTTVVEGVLSGKNTTNGTLTVDGKKLSIAAGVTGVKAVADYTVSTAAQKFALDQYGYVVATAPEASTALVIPTQFAYVYTIETQAASAGTGLIGSDAKAAAAKALVAFTDGTVKVIDLSIYTKTDGKAYYVKPASDGKVAETELGNITSGSGDVGNWFGYTENEDGTYTLAAISEVNAKVVGTGVTVNANKTATIEGKYTNSATGYLAVNTKSNSYAVTEATGLYGRDIVVANGNKSLITYAKDSKVVSNVYMVDYSITEAAAPTVKLDYALALTAGDEVANGTEWTFLINGEEVTYVISDGTVAENNVYTLTEVATGTKAGTYTASASLLDVTTGAKAITVADETFFVLADGTVVYYPTDVDAQIFNISDGHTGEADTLEVGDYVVYITGAKLIYIVDAPTAT